MPIEQVYLLFSRVETSLLLFSLICVRLGSNKVQVIRKTVAFVLD
jgi:hypothetical protein